MTGNQEIFQYKIIISTYTCSNLVLILLCSVNNMVNIYEQRKCHCTKFIENRIQE